MAMLRNLYFYGYYYFLEQKGNSDLCCRQPPEAEYQFSDAARIARAASFS